jgi:hypothetical protein
VAGVYSVRLGAGNESSAGSGLAYTAPTGFVTVVRCLSVVTFPGTTFGGVYLTGAVSYLAGLIGGADLEIATINMRQVLNAGDTLTWQFQGGGGTWMVSGYNLDL